MPGAGLLLTVNMMKKAKYGAVNICAMNPLSPQIEKIKIETVNQSVQGCRKSLPSIL